MSEEFSKEKTTVNSSEIVSTPIFEASISDNPELNIQLKIADRSSSTISSHADENNENEAVKTLKISFEKAKEKKASFSSGRPISRFTCRWWR